MGTERRSMIISDEQKRETAYHEAGHALVAMMIPGTDPVHKVTIIPRGRALGLTQQLPTEDRYSQDAKSVRDIIAILMGGRAAEDLILQKPTTGAGNDIERATGLARRYVAEWGMSNLGPVVYGASDNPVFLGRDIQQNQGLSEQMRIRVDREVQRLCMSEYDRARQILEDNIEKLEAITQGLLEFETLDHHEMVGIVDGMSVEELGKRRAVKAEERRARQEEEDSTKVPGRPDSKIETENRPPPSIVPLKPGGEET